MYLPLLASALLFSGCATTPEAKLQQAYKRVDKAPHAQRPSLYAKLAKEGLITPQTRDAWIKAWHEEERQRAGARLAAEKEQRKRAEERRRMWASLTPAQRLEFEMREREMQQRDAMIAQQQAMMQWQSEQQRRENIAAAFNNIQQNLHRQQETIQRNIHRQQEINAYNARTRALSTPVNVNVNGTIYHRY